MTDEIKCDHCGAICADEWELDIYHRGCRLRAAFPEAVDKEKSKGGLLVFDVKKISEKLDATQKQK